MKILISPAKKMNQGVCESFTNQPALLEKTETLLQEIQSLPEDTFASLMHCSEKLLVENRNRFQTMDLYSHTGHAISSYVGTVFQKMDPESLNPDEQAYLQEHLRILSAFYGILKPMDQIVPYRLDFEEDHILRLYDFWGQLPAEQIRNEPIVNLASREYFALVKPYVKEVYDVQFLVEETGKYKTKGMYAKQARGMMVRWMAQHSIEKPEEIKVFDKGYQFAKELSDNHTFAFVKKV